MFGHITIKSIKDAPRRTHYSGRYVLRGTWKFGELRRLLKHPIVAAVIAGIILWFLGWISGFLPSIWAAILSGVAFVRSLVTTNIQLPIWVLILLLALCVFAPRVIIIFRNSIDNSSEETEENLESEHEDPSLDLDSLTNDERRLLELMVQLDGSPVQISHISRRLGFSKLQSQQIVEALCQYELLAVRSDPVRGSHIYLTKYGRDFVLGNKYTRT